MTVVIFFKQPTLAGKNVIRVDGVISCHAIDREVALTFSPIKCDHYEMVKIAHYQVIPDGGTVGTE